MPNNFSNRPAGIYNPAGKGGIAADVALIETTILLAEPRSKTFRDLLIGS